TSLASELNTLTSRLARIARAERSTRDFTFNTLRGGLTEVLANFPVYRTYIDEQVRPDDRKYIDWAVTAGRNQSRAADASEFGFPPGRFHRASANRARHWPHTMLATSTHDNKRSEDVRARIDVLSEMPAGWRLQLRKWSRMNDRLKTIVDEKPAPSRNDEYL